MTVVDTSAVVDLLLGIGVADEVGALFAREGELAAPDVLVFEVLAVLRRATLRGQLRDERAAGAVSDLGDLALALIPSLPLRHRVWELRRNLTAADALFVALAEELGEPLVTKDAALADAATTHTGVVAIQLAERR